MSSCAVLEPQELISSHLTFASNLLISSENYLISFLDFTYLLINSNLSIR